MSKSKIITRIIAIVLLIAMCMTLILPIFAHAGSKEDFNAAQVELDRINKELNNIKNEKKKQQVAKQKAQSQISLIKQQIAALTADVNETNERLTIKQQELDAKKLDLQKTDELFKERLKAMYIKRSGGTLATVLAVDNYADFLTASVNLQKVSQADTDLLKKLDAEKKAIEIDEAAIQEELKLLEEKKAAQEAKRNDVAALLQVINSDLSNTAAQEEATKGEYDEAYAAYSKAKAAVEEEFKISGGVGDFVGGEWRWPVPSSRRVTSSFGNRIIFGAPDFHTGVDIGAGYAQPIIASNAGVVTVASYGSTGYGNKVMIDHGGGYRTLYGHCSSLAVAEGQAVAQGDVIAYIGSTGLSTGNHLHFEIRIGDQKVDPYPYIQNN